MEWRDAFEKLGDDAQINSRDTRGAVAKVVHVNSIVGCVSRGDLANPGRYAFSYQRGGGQGLTDSGVVAFG